MPSARSPVHNGMKKIVLMGRSEAGKTTLTQALKEYAQTKNLGHALALYTYEADVVGLLVSAIEPYCLYPPCITNMCNREVIGIVTKIHHPEADVARAEGWLRLAGCKTVFYVDSKTGEGVAEILEHLREPGDILPWEKTTNPT